MCHQQRQQDRHMAFWNGIIYVYTIQDRERTETLGTPACIALALYVSPSTETLKELNWPKVQF
jgi:hypothetical protein